MAGTQEYFCRPPDYSHPYYQEILRDYMDLNIISRKLDNGDYLSPFGFVEDLNQIWIKAFRFPNTSESKSSQEEYLKVTRELSRVSQQMVKEEIETLPLAKHNSQAQVALQQTLQRYRQELVQMIPGLAREGKQDKQKKKEEEGVAANQNPVAEDVMTFQERQQLGQKIQVRKLKT